MMFNNYKKQYKKLKEKYEELNKSNKALNDHIIKLENEHNKPFSITPDTCKTGNYCKACTFCTEQTIRTYSPTYGVIDSRLLYCTKDMCKEFVKFPDPIKMVDDK